MYIVSLIETGSTLEIVNYFTNLNNLFMKKITSKKLLNYGAMSAALMGVAGASGQIMYTDIDDVTLTPGTDTVDIDLLGTGAIDFQAQVFDGAGGAGAVIFPGENGNVNANNGLIGTSSAGFTYPSNLVEGDVIDGASPVILGDRGDLNFYSCAYSNSQFCGGVTDGYIGLVFDLNGDTHYGWVRVDLSADATSYTVKDYALNLTPDEAIAAGQETLSLEDNSIEGFSSFVADNILNVRANSVIENISIHNIAGQKVISQKVLDISSTVNLNNLTTGVYIATIAVEGKQQAIKIVKK